jgi:predicted permease
MEFRTSIWFVVVIILLVIWDLAWKMVAMWKAATKKQMGWFICLGVLNTVGILPIIYILIQRNK